MKLLRFDGEKLNIKVMSTILLLLMFILFGLNTNNVDMPTYKSIYNLYIEGQIYLSSNIEIGFKCLFYVFGYFKLDYQYVIMFISIFGLTLIYWAASKYTNRVSVLLFLFFLFPFFHQVTIIRNFVALCICFFSIQYLIKKNNIKYSICILIASLFHQSAIIYMIFLLVNINYKKFDWYILGTFIAIIVILLTPYTQNFLSIFLPKFSMYLQDSTRFITKITIFFQYFLMLFIAKYFLKHNLIDEKYYDCSIIMYKCLKIGILFVPLAMISMDYFRLIENSMLLFYVIVSNSKLIIELRIKKIFFLFLLFIILQIYVFQILFSFDKVVYMIIENNLLW